MTLNQLIYFKTIANLQHYHKSAQVLNISQPSLSRSMSNLEEELGIILFERNGRNIYLTKYGMIFLEHVTKILEEIDLTENKMKQLAGDKSGHIDVAYVSPLSRHFIPHSIRRFLNAKTNEKVTFTLTQEFTANMIQGLKDQKYDVAFGSYRENEPSLCFVPILKHELVIITPPFHPLTSQQEISICDIMDYPLITYDRHSGLGRFTHKLFDLYHIHPKIAFEASDEAAISALVSEGFGIALVSNIPFLLKDSVHIIHLTEDISHSTYMIYLKDQYQIPAVKNFIKFIVQQNYIEPDSL